MNDCVPGHFWDTLTPRNSDFTIAYGAKIYQLEYDFNRNLKYSKAILGNSHHRYE